MDLRKLNQLNGSELRSLIGSADGICISIFMPVQQESDKWDENRIRLKNLVQAAEEKLGLPNLHRPDAKQLLAPLEDLVIGGRFVATGGPGLAIFLTKDWARAYQLPYAPEEAVAVSSDFSIKPLMPLRSKEHFYILALSQQEVRLLCATQYTVEQMDLRDVPGSIDEALRWDDPERELQWHSQTGNQGNGRAAIFHGHGVGTKEIHKENLLRYFQLLDRGISKHLAHEDAPLILAGVDYLMPIYRQANTYDYLIELALEGSQQRFNDEEIQQQAWKVIQPYFRRKREATVSRYHQLASKELASTDLTIAVPAAHQGRVDTLFVALDEQRWGKYDPGTGRIELHARHEPGDIDLLNLAATHTFLNGGEVYASRCEDVPEAQPLAAIFRF